MAALFASPPRLRAGISVLFFCLVATQVAVADFSLEALAQAHADQLHAKEVPVPLADPDKSTDQVQAEKDIDAMNDAMEQPVVDAIQASWVDNTDHTNQSAIDANTAATAATTLYLTYWDSTINAYDYESFKDDDLLQRRFFLQSAPKTTALSEEDQTQLNADISEMSSYALQNMCPHDKTDCDPATEGINSDEVEMMMATLRNWNDLLYYWQGWRDMTGRPAKKPFLDYVDLMNKAATMPDNGFADAGEMWLQPYRSDDYTTDDFKNDVDALWDEMSDLYYKLHAYVRYKIKNTESGVYDGTFGDSEPIPSHILGNMWAQEWQNIYDLVAPYPDVPLVDISDALTNISNVTMMFQYAENFFTSIRLYSMTDDFWAKSMFEDPAPEKVAVCHASAWDFRSVDSPQDSGDYRIKMCTDKTQDDFITIHHEMGHIEYFMAYSKDPDVGQNVGDTRPLIFRNGANPGFHEAVGDTIALSVSTTSHLEGLYEDITGNEYSSIKDVDPDQLEINQQMKMGLSKIAFIPYAYILDKYRWAVFAGEYSDDELNYEWWKMRVQIQGVSPPVTREKDGDFDVASKYHVTANVPYIRYFVSYILQFQFQERLCDLAYPDGSVELSDCDIYGKTDAGNALKDMLQKGMTETWIKQLGDFLGHDGRMNVTSIKNYFAKLDGFLTDQQSKIGYKTEIDQDIDSYFISDIPPTVPIVVGIVLLVMIGIVIIAFFVGKSRQDKKKKEVEGVVNATFDMEEKRSKASSIASKVEDVEKAIEK